MRALLLLVLACAGGSVVAQPAPPSIAVVLEDANGDFVPDALGDTVTVAGRATVDEGTYGSFGSPLFIEDETAGLAVRFEDGVRSGRPIVAGDRLVLTGTLDFYAGVAFVSASSAEHLGGGPPPSARPYDPADADILEGRLVEAEGTVVGVSSVTAGQALMISLDDMSLVVAFAFRGKPQPVSFDDLEAGDRVRVTGVAGQYDRSAPFTDSHQIYPRSQDDLEMVGVSPSVYRWAALITFWVLIMVVGLAIWLRYQVRRRVAALHASEDRYQQLVERASDAVFVHDLDGTNVEGNQAARFSLGVDVEGDIRPLFEAVSDEDHPTFRAHLEALAENGIARSDLRMKYAGGRLFEVESQIATIDDATRALSLGRDVDERRAYEQELIAARREAEDAARLKSSFLANMSHEIRTPLTAVIGFAELLHDEVDADQRDLVEGIESGGRRLLTTLNSILDLAALDAREHALNPSVADVAVEVRDVACLLLPLASERGLALEVDAPDALMAFLDVDAVGRILTNLVGNAIKFTTTGGITIGLEADDDRVALRVQDTGVGISEEFLPRLFAAFRQVSEGFGRSHEGSGLGLTITQRLIEEMEGTIEVESELGVGTTFTVTLPRGLEDVAGDGQVAEPALM